MKTYNIFKKVLIAPRELQWGVLSTSVVIKQHYLNTLSEGEELLVIPILQGGWVFSSDILKCFDRYGKPLSYKVQPIVAKSYHDDVESSKVEIDLSSVLSELTPQGDLPRHVLIVDDIYETGKTLKAVTEKIKEFNPLSLEIAVLCERKVSHEVDMEVKWSAFEVEEMEFLIGYGLDWRGGLRDLPYIALLDHDKMDLEPYEDVYCNICGESCQVPQPKEKDKAPYGLINQVVRGGYFSPYLNNITAYRFDICEKCLKDIFNKCVIPPEEFEYDVWTGEIRER